MGQGRLRCWWVVNALIGTLILLGSCSSDDGSTPERLRGTVWELSTFTDMGGNPTTVMDEVVYQFLLDPERTQELTEAMRRAGLPV